MSMQDPISDMLTRIRNAQKAGRSAVSMPHSKVKAAIARVLEEEGYIGAFEVAHQDKKASLTIALKYFDEQPVIEYIRGISKPGLRVYAAAQDLPVVKDGLGIVIVSTSKGVMSGKQAKQLGQGGEVLCEVA